ncbi:MAG: FAD-binding oxidoreductase [Micropepsaceae bacterium]
MTAAAPLGPTWYEASAPAAPSRPALAGAVTADVCVIGGGYAGLSAALHLAKAGFRTVLLEARSVGGGASGRNGGQIHSGQRKDQEDLERELGDAHARDLWTLAEDAKALVRGLIAEHAIDCDLKDGILHAAWKRADAEPLRRYVDHMAARYGYAQSYIEAKDIPAWVATSRYHGATHDPGGGQLHPLKFAHGLARAAEAAGAIIYEGSAVTALDDTRAVTTDGHVAAQHFVLACDTWLGELDAKAGRAAIAINSFIAVTTPLGDRATTLIPSDLPVADTKFVVDYYRLTADGRLLFGGGENYTPRYPSDLKAFVAKPVHRVFPQIEDVPFDYAWGGPVGVTLSRLPHFGHANARTVFAHGFSGQGVALATLAGQLMAEATAGQAGRFDVFAKLKHRPLPGGRLLRTPIMALGMAWYALKDRLLTLPSWPGRPGHEELG